MIIFSEALASSKYYLIVSRHVLTISGAFLASVKLIAKFPLAVIF